MTVYHTAHGKRFHSESCPFISGRQHIAGAAGLQPCCYCQQQRTIKHTQHGVATITKIPSNENSLASNSILHIGNDDYEQTRQQNLQNYKARIDQRRHAYVFNDRQLLEIADRVVQANGQIPIASSINQLKNLSRAQQIEMYYAVLWNHDLCTWERSHFQVLLGRAQEIVAASWRTRSATLR